MNLSFNKAYSRNNLPEIKDVKDTMKACFCYRHKVL